MKYDVRHIHGVALLTSRWSEHRDELFEYACNCEDQRWLREDFRERMRADYFDTDVPITLRLYELDIHVQQTVLRYVDEFLTRGLVSQDIEL